MPIELTRREVVKAGLTTAAGTIPMLTGCTSTSEAHGPVHDMATDRVLVLSDTHIAADPERLSRAGVNMANRLIAVIDDATARAYRFTLINGDTAYDIGERGDYELLGLLTLRKTSLAAFMEPLHVLLGNHDDRDNFRAVLGDPASDLVDKHVRKLGVADGSRFCDWLLLDSLRIVDETPGELEAAQLAWMDEALGRSPDRPVIIAVHHPPVPDDDPDRPFALQDHEAFWAIVEQHPNVKAVLHGHTHRWEPRTWPLNSRASATPGPAVADRRREAPREIPLIGLPPTSYVFDEANPWGYVVADVDRSGTTFTLRAMDGHEADGASVRVGFG